MKRRTVIGCGALALWLAACGESRPQGTPTGAGAVVLALGDSLTEGYGAQAGEDFPSLLARSTAWQVVNSGISGDTSAQALARLPELLAQHRPQLVLISIGGNDFLRRLPEAETRANIRAMITQVRGAGAQPVLIGVPSLSAGAVMGMPGDHKLYREIAQAEGVALFSDGWSAVLKRSEWRSDQIHPNAAGYAVFARELEGFLRKNRFL